MTTVNAMRMAAKCERKRRYKVSEWNSGRADQCIPFSDFFVFLLQLQLRPFQCRNSNISENGGVNELAASQEEKKQLTKLLTFASRNSLIPCFRFTPKFASTASQRFPGLRVVALECVCAMPAVVEHWPII